MTQADAERSKAAQGVSSELFDERDLRSQLAAVIESSDDAIISKTLEGIIRTWNKGAERIFGYTADEVIGKSITILIPPERRNEETEILSKLRSGQRVEHYETIRVRKDGAAINISLTSSPVKDLNGAIVGASKVARDITERKQIEARVQESEGRLRTVVEATPDCVTIVAPDGAIEYINPAGIAMVEVDSLASIKGASIFSLVAREHRAEWLTHHTRICGGEKLSWQFELVGLAGTRRWMETHAVPLTLSDGRLGQLAVTRDVTERKLADTEREQLLASERAARAEAERSSMMKDEFLATLSHELRTPLNAILGWSQLLRQRSHSPEELEEGLAVIERNTRVQTQLIEELLDMSRITSGKVRLDVQQVDLQDVVKAALASVKHSAEAKAIRLQAVVDPLSDSVRGDPGRLQQCFWNLLTNAIKFTPKGGKVQVSLQRVNSHVEVCVVDNGAGIAADFLPHVFERFRQADASTTRNHGGLGLGLAIVKHLVELHGGKVRAMSAGEGRGSTFCIELPIMVVHANSSTEKREHPRAQFHDGIAIEHPSLEGITVLAVDDEADARDLIKRVLENCGAKVFAASSAQEAMNILATERVQMIISDIGMPGEDGYEFIKRVRALSPAQGGRTPAAALTAFARAEDRTRALRAGYQSHVAKPVEPTELTAVVASLATRA